MTSFISDTWARATWVVGLVALAGSASTVNAQSPSGDLRVVVFQDSEPAADIQLSVGGQSETTGRDGSAVFSLPPGLYPIRVLADGGSWQTPTSEPVKIVAGQVVEALITLATGGAIDSIDVETGSARGGDPSNESGKPQQQVLGTVKGRITNDKSPVAEAQIFVRGTALEAQSSVDGTFTLTVPVGTAELTVIHPRFSTANQTVTVVGNQETTVAITVEKATPKLEDFVVSAPHIEGGVASLVTERRESTSVADVIGAEEMSRSGDGDAAGALKRVTGITVVGGRFVYVRGMGERYSSTLLNGQGLPSPEPEKRVIPLNMFSTDVLQSVLIQKTPSPDIPGEFGGGLVKLRTKGFPEQLSASVSISSGGLTNTAFHDRPMYAGGDLDFLGLDDGNRGLPSQIRDQSPLREGNRFEEGLSPEELATLGTLLPARYNVTESSVPLNRSLSATIGDKRSIRGRTAGYFLSASYSDEYASKVEVFRRFVSSGTAEDGLQLNNDFLIRDLGRTINGAAMLALGIEPAKGHSISTTSLLLRITNNETSQVSGRSDDLGRNIQRSRLRFAEQQLLAQQIVGEHTIGALGNGKLEWRYAFSLATRDEPDRREYFYVDESVDPDDDNPDFQISGRPGGNQRVWNALSDRVHDAGLDYTQPIALGSGDTKRTLSLKAGFHVGLRSRDNDTIRLTLRAPRELSAEDRRLDPESIWSTENINAESGWILEDTTQPTDAYAAKSQVYAGYAMATYPVTPALEFMAGLRLERARLEVVTFAPFAVDSIPLEAVLANTDPLPSATVKWQLTDETIVRGGFGRTVTRPDFRELSESQYRDVVTATRFVGNPELVRGTIDNFDARVEHYFSSDESLSLGVFYKGFTNPIERVDLGGVDRSVSWDNADGATNFGLELDGRIRFGFLHSGLEPLFAAFNLALIQSEVRLGEEGQAASTSAERALQGQSPFVINAQLGYDNNETTAAVLVNVFGDRIRDVGRFGAPDIFEESTVRLDLVLSQTLPRGLKLSLKAKNLIDPERIYRQGPKIVRQTRLGRSLSVGLGWRY